jgi:KRAB domain-containing zinc finger protein
MTNTPKIEPEDSHGLETFTKTNEETQNKLVCPACKKYFFSLSQQRRHVAVCRGSYKCEHCNVIFRTRREIGMHHTKAHFKTIKNCPVCFVKYSKTDLVKQWHKCEFCPKEYKSEWTLKRHINFVHKNVRFSCNCCDKQFKNKGDLRIHIQVTHEAPAFACDQCSSYFTRACYLKLHRKTHEKAKLVQETHNNDTDGYLSRRLRRYACNFCKRKFFHECMYKAHIQTHAEDK